MKHVYAQYIFSVSLRVSELIKARNFYVMSPHNSRTVGMILIKFYIELSGSFTLPVSNYL